LTGLRERVTDQELKREFERRLLDARSRTFSLISSLSDDDLLKQHSPIMSPLIWDVAHIGSFEELWLVQELGDAMPISSLYDEMYDAFKNPRRDRVNLPLLDRAQAAEYLGRVRSAALDSLWRADLRSNDPLTRDGYVFEMILQHEYQHDETMLATLQLMADPGYLPPLPAQRRARVSVPDMVFVEAGPFAMGTDDRCTAYDNERSAHEVHLPGYWIDAGPVTNGAYLEFVGSGGYARREHWSAPGWRWLEETAASAPQFWEEAHGTWVVNAFGHRIPLNPREPVQHVCFYEAEAFASWAGKRLPSEAEWEKAASWDSRRRAKRTYPWGDDAPTPEHANLDQLRFRPTEVGAYPLGVSPYGCHQMIGDVWEWVATSFHGYPGFEPWPYREYSEVFFGDEYKILRGGSWAVRPGAIRATFRNWDFPIRRQIFSGFRCARDA
jgi:iron(II)-dependent oxidoreductase